MKNATAIPVLKISNPSELKHLRIFCIYIFMCRFQSLYLIIEHCPNSLVLGRGIVALTLLGTEVSDYIFSTLDRGKVSVVVLLDYLIAFDTIDIF